MLIIFSPQNVSGLSDSLAPQGGVLRILLRDLRDRMRVNVGRQGLLSFLLGTEKRKPCPAYKRVSYKLASVVACSPQV